VGVVSLFRKLYHVQCDVTYICKGGIMLRSFLLKKDISLSPKVYFVDALSYMALGLFSSLIIGLIIKTIGEPISEQFGTTLFIDMGSLAMSLMGPAIGAAVAFGLKAPPLVLFSAIISGAAGA